MQTQLVLASVAPSMRWWSGLLRQLRVTVSRCLVHGAPLDLCWRSLRLARFGGDVFLLRNNAAVEAQSGHRKQNQILRAWTTQSSRRQLLLALHFGRTETIKNIWRRLEKRGLQRSEEWIAQAWNRLKCTASFWIEIMTHDAMMTKIATSHDALNM